VGVTWR